MAAGGEKVLQLQDTMMNKQQCMNRQRRKLAYRRRNHLFAGETIQDLNEATDMMFANIEAHRIS